MAVIAPAGTERLIHALDGAVRRGKDVNEVTDEVKRVLSRLITSEQVSLPEELCQPKKEGYSRRLLHRSGDLGYELIAMIWGPEQGTPLHDHAGIWCVEGVYKGEIRVRQYDLVESRGDLHRFQAQELVEAHIGESGSLIPPFEYHTIHNNLPDATSITLHVYGGAMDHCCVYLPEGDGWYREVEKDLSYD